jgi:hypothetical protein
MIIGENAIDPHDERRDDAERDGRVRRDQALARQNSRGSH